MKQFLCVSSAIGYIVTIWLLVEKKFGTSSEFRPPPPELDGAVPIRSHPNPRSLLLVYTDYLVNLFARENYTRFITFSFVFDVSSRVRYKWDIWFLHKRSPPHSRPIRIPLVVRGVVA